MGNNASTILAYARTSQNEWTVFMIISSGDYHVNAPTMYIVGHTVTERMAIAMIYAAGYIFPS